MIHYILTKINTCIQCTLYFHQRSSSQTSTFLVSNIVLSLQPTGTFECKAMYAPLNIFWRSPALRCFPEFKYIYLGH